MYVSFEKSARKETGMIANLRHLAKNIDKIFCLSAYLLVLSIGCNKVERPFSKVLEPECRIQIDLKESNSFEFDDFFSGIEVVPLETSRDAILGNPKKMLVRKGCYYIHNAQQNCVTGFDADGKLTFSSSLLYS